MLRREIPREDPARIKMAIGYKRFLIAYLSMSFN
jgi:hypothetical protein